MNTDAFELVLGFLSASPPKSPPISMPKKRLQAITVQSDIRHFRLLVSIYIVLFTIIKKAAEHESQFRHFY